MRAPGAQGPAAASVHVDASDGLSGTWIGQAWNWLVSIFAEDNGFIVP
jgi:hypothetical protein